MWETLLEHMFALMVGFAIVIPVIFAVVGTWYISTRVGRRTVPRIAKDKYDLPIEFWHKGWKVSIIRLKSGKIGYNVRDINENVMQSGSIGSNGNANALTVVLKKKIDRKVWDDAYDISFGGSV